MFVPTVCILTVAAVAIDVPDIISFTVVTGIAIESAAIAVAALAAVVGFGDRVGISVSMVSGAVGFSAAVVFTVATVTVVIPDIIPFAVATVAAMVADASDKVVPVVGFCDSIGISVSMVCGAVDFSAVVILTVTTVSAVVAETMSFTVTTDVADIIGIINKSIAIAVAAVTADVPATIGSVINIVSDGAGGVTIVTVTVVAKEADVSDTVIPVVGFGDSVGIRISMVTDAVDSPAITILTVTISAVVPDIGIIIESAAIAVATVAADVPDTIEDVIVMVNDGAGGFTIATVTVAAMAVDIPDIVIIFALAIAIFVGCV